MTAKLPARDIVDVRLSAAIAGGGCAICSVRTRSERGTMDSIIAERVLDIGFREGLEREHAFCRRHAAELIVADRRAAGILGSSILYGAMITRRVATLREALALRGRGRRGRLERVLRRPACLACAQGVSGVDVALARLSERASDAAWGPVIAEIPFCMDDLVALLATGGDAPAMARVAERQLARLDDLARRLDGYAYHSAQDRRHLLTEDERSAADEAARMLGGF